MESQSRLKMALAELNVVSEVLEDLRPADVSTTHQSELTADAPIYFRPRRLPPLLNNVEEE